MALQCFRLIAGAVLAFSAVPAFAQVLDPPSLPGQDDLAAQIVRMIEAKDLAGYSALLADDLRVYEDGREAFASKDAWLKSFGKKLTTPGVSFRVSSGFSSTGRLLFIEYFNSAGSWDTAVPQHCCWSYDAVAYDIKDNKVSAIYRLRGGDKKLENPAAK